MYSFTLLECDGDSFTEKYYRKHQNKLHCNTIYE